MSPRAPTLPRLSVDKVYPGIIRIEGADNLTGILAGLKAPEIVRRCNSHDALVAALEEWSDAHGKILLDDGRLVPCGCVMCASRDAALKAAKGAE